MPETLEHDALLPAAVGDGEATFDEPWQAELLALAYSLADRGVFSRSEWSEQLGATLCRAATDGAPDTLATYYAAVLEALETLLARSGQVSAQALSERTESWRRAYLATPHGEPVLLSAGMLAESG